MKVFTHRTFGVINVVMFNSKEYFDAISVTRILGYANRHDAINKHCNKEGVLLQEIGIECGEDRSGEPIVKLINRKFIDEANVYRLISKSKFNCAREFERWICEDILPSIRRYKEVVSDSSLDRFLATLVEDGVSVGTFAKVLRSGDIDIGRNRLYSWLRDKGYLMKSKQERNNPKQRYIESGLFKVRERIVTTRKGAKVVVTPFITCKGQLYLLEAIKKDLVR